MKALFVKNIDVEDGSTIEQFLRSRGFEIAKVNASKEPLPNKLTEFSILVFLGGPMGVYEADKYPFLNEEFKLIEKAMLLGKKILGICLGAQMIAHVLGAKVYKGEFGKEIGWFDIFPQGELEDLFERRPFKAFQWHGDTFDIPKGAKKLASSVMYPNQAFSFKAAYALQFHIEVTKRDIVKWIDVYRKELEEEKIDPKTLLEPEDLWKDLKLASFKFMDYFIKV